MKLSKSTTSKNSNIKVIAKTLSPIKALRRKRRLKAAKALLGMWATKDISFFDKR
jgi:hypothetical protein